MSKHQHQKSSENLKRYEPTSARSNSSDQSMEAQQGPKPPSPKKFLKSLIVVIIFLLVLQIGFNRPPPIKYNNIQFDFHVYCPLSFEKNLMAKSKSLLEYLPFHHQSLLESLKFNKTYIVNMRTVMTKNPNNQGQKIDQQFQFCGLARPWDGTCEKDAQYVCSNPGPVFDLKTNEEINVFWINQIKEVDPNLSWQGVYSQVNSCYKNKTSEIPHRCYQKIKTDNWFGCTYLDPTDLGENSSSHELSLLGPKNVPTSTHIHGLEVRPYFDGNPLSWISRKGRGIGFLSYEQEYFNVLSDFERDIIYRFYDTSSQFVKMNVYPNHQLPGSLWYHDHAMASTGFNVAKGLNGMYLLRDNQKEDTLPKGEYEAIILLHLNSQQMTISKRKAFNLDAWYRIRILNSNFRKHYEKLRFLDQNKSQIQFTLIGQDSAMMRDLINIKQFDLASAERSDLLIKFCSTKLKEGDIVYLVYLNKEENETLIPLKMGPKETDQEILHFAPPKKLDVPFKNLTTVPVDQKRMRPLFMKNGFFSINGHTAFDMGKSDNPQIGTVEDWYFVNTITNPHPIHVHLINFQIVLDYKLKDFSTTPAGGNCTYYEIDFFLKYADQEKCFNQELRQLITRQKNNPTNYTLSQDMYNKACQTVSAMGKDNLTACFREFGNQHQFQNGVSGISIYQELESGQFNYTDSANCTLSSYKYICHNVTEEIPMAKRGWKEVSFVPAHHARAVRIRWKRTDYDEELHGTKYFHVPEKHLIEFPGFVYHCHYLPHEDNEMMRPFIMQPSEHYLGMKQPLWKDIYKQVNQKAKCGTPQNRGSDLRRI